MEQLQIAFLLGTLYLIFTIYVMLYNSLGRFDKSYVVLSIISVFILMVGLAVGHCSIINPLHYIIVFLVICSIFLSNVFLVMISFFITFSVKISWIVYGYCVLNKGPNRLGFDKEMDIGMNMLLLIQIAKIVYHYYKKK